MGVKPGYKQSEVGVIPEDWDVVPLGDLKPFVTSGSRGWASFYSDRGSLFVRITNLSRESVYLDLTNSKFVKLPPEASEGVRTQLKEHDLLISITADIGIVGYIDASVPSPAYINQHIALVRFDASRACGKFVSYFLASEKPQRLFRASTDIGAKAGMSLITVQKIQTALPPLPEQRAIATALSDVDGLLGGLDRLIAKKRDLKQAAMQQLLTPRQGSGQAGQTRLPGFHGEWENFQIQDVITRFFCGPSPTCEERNIQEDDEWGVLKTTAVTRENGWRWTKHKTLPRVFWNKPHLELKKGDVIVTKAGPRHRVGVTAWVDYVPPRIIVSGKMIGLRPCPDKVVPLMLAAAISAREPQVYLDQRTTGMAESQVNFENRALLEAPIRIPRIEEQTAIAEVLTDMDAELAALEQRREKTSALKQAMMQELLTGRIRLV